MNHSRSLLAAVAVASTLLLAGCGGDDGAGVTPLDESSGSGSASSSGSGSASGSGSGSGSGLGSELQKKTDNALVADAVAQYTEYVHEQVDQMVEKTKVLTDAVRAGDLEAARAAYAPSRVPWERIEPIAGLVPDIDTAVDARVDDFAGVDDPEFTGWHRLEYFLFAEDTTEGAAEFATKLDEDLAILQQQIEDLEIPAAAVPVGASELIEEVSIGKLTGEEDRYSDTDLWDIDANIEGAQQAVTYLMPALEEADPELAGQIDDSFAALRETLEPLRDGDGWQLFCLEDPEYPSDRCEGEPTIDSATIDQLKAQTAALAELLSQMAGALGLSAN